MICFTSHRSIHTNSTREMYSVKTKVITIVTGFNSAKTRNCTLFTADQHQISPCNINAYSTPKVMRVKDMITKVNFLDILISTLIRKEWGEDRQICSLI